MKMKITLAFAAAAAAINSHAADCVKVSQFGFNRDDSTAFVQAALDSGAKKVIFDRQPWPWVVNPVFARSNTEIVFEEGVELLAKRGEFRTKRDSCLLNMVCVTNVSLRGIGKGGRLRMWIKDYHSQDYSKSEWRHALNIMSSAKITVEKMAFVESGGDGIYLGEKVKPFTNTDIVIRDCVFDANNRQGISVITVDGLLVERTVLSNTYGTNPKAGIDFEPNNAHQKLKRIVMRDCLSKGNHGKGFEFYLAQLRATSDPVDALIENCRSDGDRGGAFVIAMGRIADGRTVPGGLIKVKNCTFENSPKSGIGLSNKNKDSLRAVFENCTISNCPSDPAAKQHPVSMFVYTFWNPPVDGVEFNNLRIVQNTERDWLRKNAFEFLVPVTDISGDVHIETNGRKSSIVLDERWRKANFKVKTNHADIRLSEFDPKKDWVIVDAKPGEKTEFAEVCLRYKSSAIIYADSKRTVEIEGRTRQIGKKAKRFPAMVVRDMDGRRIAAFKPFGAKRTKRSFKVPAKGFYRIEWDVDRGGVTFNSCNAPFAIESGRDGIDLYRANATVYVSHRRGDVDTVLCGGGGGETVNVEIVSPSLKKAAKWNSLGEWAFKRLDEEGLWSIRFSKPDAGVYEDTFATVVGDSPSLIFLSAEKYWK